MRQPLLPPLRGDRAARAAAAAAGNADAARLAYAAGIKRCLDCIPLWVSAARLEERAGNVAKARALLEQARLKNPKNAQLWLAAVRTELRAQNQKAGEALMAKALQDCPDSGPLWAETINMAPRPQRKSRSGARGGPGRAGRGCCWFGRVWLLRVCVWRQAARLGRPPLHRLEPTARRVPLPSPPPPPRPSPPPPLQWMR